MQTLMNAWADGLNYFLATHPEVKPRVLRRFEPWMALSFTEGSIGGDIERIDLNGLRNFYGSNRHAELVSASMNTAYSTCRTRCSWIRIKSGMTILSGEVQTALRSLRH